MNNNEDNAQSIEFDQDNKQVKHNIQIHTRFIPIRTIDDRRINVPSNLVSHFPLIGDWLEGNPGPDEEFNSRSTFDEMMWLMFLAAYRPSFDIEDWFGSNIKVIKDSCHFKCDVDGQWELNFCFPSIKKTKSIVVSIIHIDSAYQKTHKFIKQSDIYANADKTISEFACIELAHGEYKNDTNKHSHYVKTDTLLNVIDLCKKHFNITKTYDLFTRTAMLGDTKRENAKIKVECFAFILHYIMTKEYASIAARLSLDTQSYELMLKWLLMASKSDLEISCLACI
jgi:hypothetical protein